jgi:glycosyltransferase 2 family protein
MEGRSTRPARSAIRWLLVLLLGGAAIHVLLPLLGPLEHALEVARTLPLVLVGAAVLFQMVSYVGSGLLLRWGSSLVGAPVPIHTGIGVTLAASSASLVGGGPMGFAAASSRWLRGLGLKPEAALLGGWLPQALNLLVQAGVGGMGILLLGLVAHRLPALLYLPLLSAGFVLLLGIAAGAWVWTHPDGVPRLFAMVARVRARIRRPPADPEWAEGKATVVRAAMDALGEGRWKRPLSGSVLNVAGDLATLYLLFLAAGVQPAAGVLVAGWAIPLLIGRLTFLPGGIGVVEGGMTGLYAALGLPTEAIVVVVLLYRALSFWIPSLLGAPLAFWYERRAWRSTQP